MVSCFFALILFLAFTVYLGIGSVIAALFLVLCHRHGADGAFVMGHRAGSLSALARLISPCPLISAIRHVDRADEFRTGESGRT